MKWNIISNGKLCKERGTEFYKIKHTVQNSETNEEYIVLQWSDNPCIIYDKCNDELLSKYNWSYMKHTGYAYAHVEDKKCVTMHSVIMKEKYNLSVEKIENYSIDHINQIKTYNIFENLRYATQSEQNSNRETRKDKVPPPDELIKIGITSLPRHVRYDKSEKKFVIERNHPGLQKVPGTFNYSGTKSTTVSVVYKYYDILKKLSYLDSLISNSTLLEKQKKLFNDYAEITFLITGEKIKEIDYTYSYNIKELEQHLTETERSYERRGLPENVEIEKDIPGEAGNGRKNGRSCFLPEYCCYVKEKGNRGDQFYVSRHHPHLKSIGVSDVRTTGSKAVSTTEKYNKLMELIKTINSHQGDELKQKL